MGANEIGPELVCGIVLLAGIVVAVIGTIRAGRATAKDGPAAALWHACLACVGALYLMYLMAYAVPDLVEGSIVNAIRGFFEAAYAVFLTIGCQAPTTEVIELVDGMLASAGGASAALSMVFTMVLVPLCFLLPLVAVSAVVAQFWSLLRDWQLVLMRIGHKEAYLLTGLDEPNAVLAHSVFEHFDEGAKEHPLVVFCDVDESAREAMTSLVEQLEEEGKGHVLITSRSLVDTLATLERDKKFLFLRLHHDWESIRCLFLADDYAANVISSIHVIDRIVQRALAEPNEEDAKKYAARFSVYCLHDNPENELVFDSLVYGGVGEEEDDASTMVERNVRLSMEIRLMSRAREQAFDLFTRHPLFDVLDKPSSWTAASLDDAARQQLYVVVVGLGSYGIETLKTAYWMGRMHGVDLHVWGIDQEGKHIGAFLRETCPAMMGECGRDGNPVVAIKEAEVFTPTFEEELAALPEAARVYAVVSLGDDQLNLNVSLWMRRFFDGMRRTGHLHGASHGALVRQPMILPLINSKEVASAAKRMNASQKTKGDELRVGRFELVSFGETDEVFSYQNLIEAPWERRALAMNAAYREVWDSDVTGCKGVDAKVARATIKADYAEFEIKKLSNRTNVRHIPYKLWCLGLDPHAYYDEDGALSKPLLDQETWWRALGVERQDVPELMRSYSGTRENMLRDLRALRERYPVPCAVGDLEHERWMAFYFSQGWRDLTIEGCEELVRLGLVSDLQVHQSPKLRLHCYLCPTEELLERGSALPKPDDAYVYDRAAVLEIPRILDESIFA